MTEKYFHQLSGPPKAGVLKGYPNADKCGTCWFSPLANVRGSEPHTIDPKHHLLHLQSFA